MEVEPIEPEPEPEPVAPSEPVLLKKRGRPKGALNKKTVAKNRQDVLPESSLHPERETPDTPEIEAHPESMVLDVDFTSLVRQT